MNKIISNKYTLTELKTISSHLSDINSICFLNDGRLASASSDRTIKLFDLSTYENVLTLSGHCHAVTYITQIDNGDLVSSGYDGELKFWSLKNAKEYKTLHPSKNLINKVIAHSPMQIIICSNDKKISVINTKTFEIEKQMVHTRGVVSILEVDNYLVSICFGRQLIIWNISDFSYRKGIDDIRCTSSDGMVDIGDGMVIVGGPDCVAVVNVISAQVVSKYGYSNYFPQNVNISFVELDNKGILVGTTSCEMFVIPKNF